MIISIILGIVVLAGIYVFVKECEQEDEAWDSWIAFAQMSESEKSEYIGKIVHEAYEKKNK
jgi:hypothetical protein